MLSLVARRLLAMIPILLGVVFLSMMLVELMPGDPALLIAGDNAPPQAVQEIRHQLRLDEPVWERFGHKVWSLAHGDLGTTPGDDAPVWNRIEATLPVTLSLALVTTVFLVVLGVSAGTLAALRRGGFADRGVTVVASVLQSVPPFVIGLVLVVVFAVDRSWFPASGYVKFGENPAEWIRHLILPALTLALGPAALIARQTRGELIDVLENDYIRAARAKGLAERRVVGKHAAKNAATTVVTILGLQLGTIVGGAVIVELIFGLPGFGILAVSAVTARDIVLIQAVVLVSALFILVSNLVVDISYGYFNPKVRV